VHRLPPLIDCRRPAPAFHLYPLAYVFAYGNPNTSRFWMGSNRIGFVTYKDTLCYHVLLA